MKLDEKLISLRKEKGITQLSVAEVLGVSRQAISRWESGTALPSTENLARLSELYHVPVDYLLNDDAQRPDRPEGSERTPDEPQKNAGTRKRYVAAVICMLIFAAAALVVWKNAGHRAAENLSFGQMSSETWSSADTEEFSLAW